MSSIWENVLWKTWDVGEMVVFILGLPSLAFVLGLALFWVWWFLFFRSVACECIQKP